MRVSRRSSRRTREAMQSRAISAASRVASVSVDGVIVVVYTTHAPVCKLSRPDVRMSAGGDRGRGPEAAREVLQRLVELGAPLGRVHTLRGAAHGTRLQALELVLADFGLAAR